MNETKYAIIFRSSDEIESGKDPYVEKFERADIKCQVIPVLNFEFINTNELKAKLSKPDHYSGIIFSSPRCVKAVRISAEDISKWKKHRIFVVGEKTGKTVETDLGLQSEGSSCGNAKALAEYILKQNVTKPLLLPTGNLSRDVLSSSLTEGGILVEQLVVYKTVPDPSIESNIKEVFDKHPVTYMVYFSPSAIDITFPIFSKQGIQLNNIKWGAIGPTTEKALLEHSVQVSIVPKSPTPEQFGLALKCYLNRE